MASKKRLSEAQRRALATLAAEGGERWGRQGTARVVWSTVRFLRDAGYIEQYEAKRQWWLYRITEAGRAALAGTVTQDS